MASSDIKLLGKELAYKTRNMKHKFNEVWTYNLINLYKENKGKSLIHLSDFDENLFLKLTWKGKKILYKLLKSKEINKNSLKAIKNYLKKENKFISLKNLKHFLGKDIDIIESHIDEIKTTKSGIGKSIKSPKFPINLKTEFGAIFLGMYPDTAIRIGEFVSKDTELLDDLKNSFKSWIGETRSQILRSSSAYRMHLSPIIKILYKLSGLKTENRQIITNNGLPYWVFSSSRDFQRLLLKKLWDAEGSAPVNKKMCLGQSVVLNEVHEDIPLYPKRKSFLQCVSKERILNNPPNLLVSTQLLLYKFEIISYIKPHRLYKRKNGLIVCDWHLIITRYPNIKKFYDEIGFGLKRKQVKLKESLDSYTRNYPKSKLSREYEIISVIKDLKMFTISDVEGRVNLSKGTIRNYLIYLRKRNKIEKIRTIPQRNTRSFFNQYKIKRDL